MLRNSGCVNKYPKKVLKCISKLDKELQYAVIDGLEKGGDDLVRAVKNLDDDAAESFIKTASKQDDTFFEAIAKSSDPDKAAAFVAKYTDSGAIIYVKKGDKVIETVNRCSDNLRADAVELIKEHPTNAYNAINKCDDNAVKALTNVSSSNRSKCAKYIVDYGDDAAAIFVEHGDTAYNAANKCSDVNKPSVINLIKENGEPTAEAINKYKDEAVETLMDTPVEERTKRAEEYLDQTCFIAGTLVKIVDGHKAIEDIKIGDSVLSKDEKTGKVEIKSVTNTFVNETDEVVHININGEIISATPNHPFYVDKLGWTLAKSLHAGDVLVLSNGEFVVVEFIQHEILESPIKVYNFEVEDYHTYFVGENSVLVHNKCNRLNNQVKVYKEYTGKDPVGHVHHGLPEELRKWFEDHGITNIDDGKYYFDIPKEKHILKSGEGIHTNSNKVGKTWNASWKDFTESDPDANLEQIEAELDRLADLYEISQYRAVKKV